MKMPCVVCEIIGGRAESSLAYEDEHVIAFTAIRPLTCIFRDLGSAAWRCG